MTVEANKIKMINDDVLLKHVTKQEIRESAIWLPETGQTDEIQFFEVLRTSPSVEDVEPGEIVFLPWKDVTPPFEAEDDGKREVSYGVTSVGLIWGVIEK